MSEPTWKAVERAVAGRLRGRRTGPSGRSGPDVVSDWVQAEVKTRKRLPQWLRGALAQACASCPEHRLPLVILHETGERHDDDLVLLRLADFQDWFGDVAEPEVPSEPLLP